jgi:hypothetical protein
MRIHSSHRVVDSTMNLISVIYHSYKKKEYVFINNHLFFTHMKIIIIIIIQKGMHYICD